ncbi:DUF2793 domain-containing protein [Methylosinus sp. Ce-a6]|uniref:DUF2793 domain-containing protein n=1 Tax=Methylosinus sp. Ce-a6 TaxID=2172005 RepID=UPI001356B5D0|nr:DUF2793 domain-containing protein [Methylosinus sp. Ce-a6]
MTSTPNLALALIDANQSQKHVTHNEALRALDAIVQLAVIDDALATPPGSPADGDRYIVAASPSGAWAGQAGKIAAYQNGAWAFYTPKNGWRAWVASRSVAVVYSGSTWQSEPSLAGFRNRLRNASFAINQRAVSGTVTLAAGAYGHDGVKAGAGGATYTFAASGVDTTLTITAGSLVLPIEASLIEGGAYVLSHAGTAQARVWQTTASGSYAVVPANGLTVTGLAANTLTAAEFSTGTVLRPQFEAGAHSSAFERRPPGIEMMLCERYYQRLSGWSGRWQASVTVLSLAGAFRTRLAATPTIIIVDGANAFEEYGYALRAAISVSGSSLGPDGGTIGFNTDPSGAGASGGSTSVAKIYLSAEL